MALISPRRRFTLAAPKGGQLPVDCSYTHVEDCVGPDIASKVLLPVSKAAIHNECGLPMCAAAGLEHIQQHENNEGNEL